MSDDLRRRIDILEEGYAFMLAYAARGIGDDQGGGSDDLRRHLQTCIDAITGLATAAADLGPRKGDTAEAYRRFVAVMERDARTSEAAMRMVLARDSISSQLVDNLNASVHLRALLTDLFLIDEVLASPTEAERAG